MGHKLLFIRTFNISISIFSHNPTGLAAVLDQKLCSWISSPSFLLEHQPGHHGQPFYIRGLLFPVVRRRSPSSPSPQTSYFFHDPEEKNHLLIWWGNYPHFFGSRDFAPHFAILFIFSRKYFSLQNFISIQKSLAFWKAKVISNLNCRWGRWGKGYEWKGERPRKTTWDNISNVLHAGVEWSAGVQSIDSEVGLSGLSLSSSTY